MVNLDQGWVGYMECEFSKSPQFVIFTQRRAKSKNSTTPVLADFPKNNDDEKNDNFDFPKNNDDDENDNVGGVISGLVLCSSP